MDGLANKISSFLVALMLAVTCCLAPYAQTAYAIAQLAIPAGQALAAVLAVLGVSVAINSDDEAAVLWSDWELFTGDIDAMAEGVGKLQDTAIANGNLVNATKSNVSQQEIDAINGVFSAAGEAGSFALDQLSIWVRDGVLGVLPFILSLFVESRVNDSYVSVILPNVGSVQFASLGGSFQSKYGGTSCLFFPVCLYNGVYYARMVSNLSDIYLEVAMDGTLTNWGTVSSSFYPSQWLYSYDPGSLTVGSSLHFDMGKLGNLSTLVFNSSFNFRVYNETPYSVNDSSYDDYLIARLDGVWTQPITDNPDVNLGHDWWTDAKDKANADLLDPAAGGAVIGSDAVFDGDYIKNRGSIAIPTDWGGINSWADALGATHAGVAEGVLDGTVSKTHVGTATDTATGELVTDTVGTITKPGANTSVAVPVPGLFDGVVDAVDDKFPFCIPGDLHKCIATLGSAPVAPSFDWTFPLHHLGLQDVTIHIDLAPFDSVALILRIGLSVTMSIGLIFLSIRLLNLWGGK